MELNRVRVGEGADREFKLLNHEEKKEEQAGERGAGGGLGGKENKQGGR